MSTSINVAVTLGPVVPFIHETLMRIVHCGIGPAVGIPMLNTVAFRRDRHGPTQRGLRQDLLAVFIWWFVHCYLKHS
ncbi:hypothetical protein N7456_010581 [Penicillium angulare]|uniref:Uncharacterized protein n=1 Tax=Penicillium angulare TaxID=116970 RepID=A0A9W9F757_9EURO|nr:hypothetical protein N7456_010581 [Penicillium angulare]